MAGLCGLFVRVGGTEELFIFGGYYMCRKTFCALETSVFSPVVVVYDACVHSSVLVCPCSSGCGSGRRCRRVLLVADRVPVFSAVEAMDRFTRRPLVSLPCYLLASARARRAIPCTYRL